jgi:hypothetical protein
MWRQWHITKVLSGHQPFLGMEKLVYLLRCPRILSMVLKVLTWAWLSLGRTYIVPKNN